LDARVSWSRGRA